MVDDDVTQNVDRKEFEANKVEGVAGKPPKPHKDFGKIPKYLSKYKDDAQAKEDLKAELKAKEKLPPGMKLLSEEERVD